MHKQPDLGIVACKLRRYGVDEVRDVPGHHCNDAGIHFVQDPDGGVTGRQRRRHFQMVRHPRAECLRAVAPQVLRRHLREVVGQEKFAHLTGNGGPGVLRGHRFV
jgi:hypothetical protein